MKSIFTLFAFALTAVLPSLAVAQAEDNQCIICHQSWEDDSGPSNIFARDIHFQEGLMCNDCHGGDPTLDDMDDVRASKGWRGVPTYLQVPDFCARCHSDPKYMGQHNPGLATDQLAKYKTSIHGQRLFGKKDTLVANCVSCHSVHNIGSAKMPHATIYPKNIPFTCGKCHADKQHMAGYGIPTNQLHDWEQSVHAHALLDNDDLGAPACNSCHGNHGAIPPGVNSLAAVCGNCHAFQMQLYDKSPHKEAYEAMDLPMCEVCHGNHKITAPSDSLVGVGAGAVCTECHSKGDAGYAAAQGISNWIGNLVSTRDAADAELEKARAKGMETDDQDFAMGDVKQSLIRTRTLVHSFDPAQVETEAKKGIATSEQVRAQAKHLISEFYFRRKGLGFATLFITLLAIALYLKIRRLD